jgi:hypothetical protein
VLLGAVLLGVVVVFGDVAEFGVAVLGVPVLLDVPVPVPGVVRVVPVPLPAGTHGTVGAIVGVVVGLGGVG